MTGTNLHSLRDAAVDTAQGDPRPARLSCRAEQFQQVNLAVSHGGRRRGEYGDALEFGPEGGLRLIHARGGLVALNPANPATVGKSSL